MPEPASPASADGIPGFDFDPRTRVLFGAGTLGRLGDVVTQVGGSNVLLVTDSGLRQAGHEQRAIDLLEAAGLAVHVLDDVHPTGQRRFGSSWGSGLCVIGADDPVTFRTASASSSIVFSTGLPKLTGPMSSSWFIMRMKPSTRSST